MQTTYAENLDCAERGADRTHSLYEAALVADEDRSTLDSLFDTATHAQHSYYAALNADLAL
jgi:hypothetical protein